MLAWDDTRRLVSSGLAPVLEGMESDGLARVVLDQKNSKSFTYWTCSSLRRGAGARNKCSCRVKVVRDWTRIRFWSSAGFEMHTCKTAREGPGRPSESAAPANYRSRAVPPTAPSSPSAPSLPPSHLVCLPLFLFFTVPPVFLPTSSFPTSLLLALPPSLLVRFVPFSVSPLISHNGRTH